MDFRLSRGLRLRSGRGRSRFIGGRFGGSLAACGEPFQRIRDFFHILIGSVKVLDRHLEHHILIDREPERATFGRFGQQLFQHPRQDVIPHLARILARLHDLRGQFVIQRILQISR